MLIALLISLLNFFAPDQPKWQELTAFKIYSKISINEFHKISDADIQKLPFKQADINEAKKVLSMAKPKMTPIMWKGMGYLAVARFKDGTSRKILINTYGSSFRDATGKKDYILEDNEAWGSFMSRNKP